MHQITATVVLLCFVVQGIAQNSLFGSDDIAELRLVGGSSRCAGRLEIRPPSSSLFGQASDNDVGTNEATVICRQLNCGTDGARTANATAYGFSSLVNVFRGFGYVCRGNETIITSCRRTGAYVRDTAANAIAINCDGSPEIRIVGGLNRCEGRLEIRPPDSDLFGQASGNDVGTNEAKVICRQLNCGTDKARTSNATIFGYSSSMNVSRGFGYRCEGNETFITSCGRTSSTIRDTVESAIAIDCDGSPELKLVGGSNRCEGRLEIRPPDSDVFGQASGNDVGTNEATVICRQLNCGTDGAKTADATTFGFPSEVKLLRGFGYVCQGDETTINSCNRTDVFISLRAANAIAIDCPGSALGTVSLSVGTLASIVVAVYTDGHLLTNAQDRH